MKKIDENYFKVDNEMKRNTIEDILDVGETILWREKPNKKAYIMSKILNMLPIALIWIVFDSTFLFTFFGGLFINNVELPIGIVVGFVVFFLFHLTPVWIWLAGIIKGAKEHKNIEYVFTEKRIITRSGIIGIDFKNIYYSSIESVNLRVGISDRIFKVGDIYIKSDNNSTILFDIKNPYQITSKLQKITLDIKTDIYYPNALRPGENPGYNTKYKGE